MPPLTEQKYPADPGTADPGTLQDKLEELLAVNKATNAAINDLASLFREQAVTRTDSAAQDESRLVSEPDGAPYYFNTAELSLDELQSPSIEQYLAVRIEWTSNPQEHLLFDGQTCALRVLWEEYDLASWIPDQ
jgi:hypothetical protein